MSNLPLLNHTALDVNGVSIPSARLYFYETGTTTPLATYSNEGLTSANANPVVADTNGRFGAIYLQAQEYRVKFTDASGSTIWTRDGIKGVSLDGSAVADRQKQIASNPLDYGAVGDGVADESAEVQDAIDNATGTVDLLGKTYRCDSALTLRSGITLRNGTLDFSACADDEYIKAAGTIGDAILLTGSATIVTVLPLTSVAGISPGDLLHVRNESIVSGSRFSGELARVVSIAALDVTTDPLYAYADYTVAKSAKAYRIAPVQDIVIEDLRILCSEAASGVGTAIDITYGERIRIARCSIDAPKANGIRIEACANATVRDCFIRGDAGSAIGVMIKEVCAEVLVDRLEGRGLLYSVRVGSAAGSVYGSSRFVTIQECVGAMQANGDLTSIWEIGCWETGGARAFHVKASRTEAPVFSVVASDGADTGIYSTATAGTGMHGVGTEDGVLGEGSGANAVGVYGRSLAGYAVVAEGDTSSPAKAAFRIVPQDGAPSGPNAVGDIYCTTAGKLYICTSAGTPGTWTVVGTQS
jgi:hypothetical protein